MSTTPKPPQWAGDAANEFVSHLLHAWKHKGEPPTPEMIKGVRDDLAAIIARHAQHAVLIKRAADMLDELRTAVLARMVQGDEPSHVRVKQLMDVYDRSGKALAELRAAGE